MSFDSDLLSMIPRPFRRLPVDLTAVVGIVVLTCVAALFPGIDQNPLWIVLGLPFVLFLPGYSIIAALFPEAHDDTAVRKSQTDDGAERNAVSLRLGSGLDEQERVVLSLGTSIVIVPLIGLILNFTPLGIHRLTVLFSISGLTLAATVVAAYRRWKLPPDEQLAIPCQQWITIGRTELFEPDSQTDAILNVFFVLSLLLAVGTVTYTVAIPKQGEPFTEFYLLTENETGHLHVNDYPTEYTRGQSKPLYVGVENHEHRSTNYTVLVQLERVKVTNSANIVIEKRKLHQFRQTVGANKTWQNKHKITPKMSGKRLRLQYLLYKGKVPSHPTRANAYRELHLWVNVSSRDR